MKEKDWQNVVPKTPASLEESLNKALESMKPPPLSGGKCTTRTEVSSTDDEVAGICLIIALQKVSLNFAIQLDTLLEKWYTDHGRL